MARQPQTGPKFHDPPAHRHWRRHSPPGGLPSKIALAVLALVLLFVLVIGLLALSYTTRREEPTAPNSYVQQP
jgi:hypothetical protein